MLRNNHGFRSECNEKSSEAKFKHTIVSGINHVSCTAGYTTGTLFTKLNVPLSQNKAQFPQASRRPPHTRQFSLYPLHRLFSGGEQGDTEMFACEGGSDFVGTSSSWLVPMVAYFFLK